MKKLLITFVLTIGIVTVANSVKADGGPWQPYPSDNCFIYVDANGQMYEICLPPPPAPCTVMLPEQCPVN